MKKVVFILVLTLVLAEFFAWQIYQSAQEESLVSGREPEPKTEEQKEESSETTASLGANGPDSNDFPPPTIEVKNGKAERTIHMGVRQYAWDPSILTAKKGELVRLVIHNADVQHGLVIPDLGILEGDIPPEGTVIEFTPDKAGTFEFFCSVWCGEGHMEMRGKIVIEESEY